MSASKRPLISSVRCEVLGGHTHVTVWSRGANAGTLVLDASDGFQLASRLIPHGTDRIDVGGRLTRWALAEAKVQREGYTLTATQDSDDRGKVCIALNGEHVETVGWTGDRFEAWDLQPTPITAENDAAREALEASYTEALDHAPEPD